jgi:hypothetical protein
MSRRILDEGEVARLIELKKLANQVNCYIFDDGREFKLYRRGLDKGVFVCAKKTLKALGVTLRKMQSCKKPT